MTNYGEAYFKNINSDFPQQQQKRKVLPRETCVFPKMGRWLQASYPQKQYQNQKDEWGKCWEKNLPNFSPLEGMGRQRQETWEVSPSLLADSPARTIQGKEDVREGPEMIVSIYKRVSKGERQNRKYVTQNYWDFGGPRHETAQKPHLKSSTSLQIKTAITIVGYRRPSTTY